MFRIVIEPREPSGDKTPEQLITELEQQQNERTLRGEDEDSADVGQEPGTPAEREDANAARSC